MIFVGNTNPVGSAVAAMLTEAQFQAQNGTGWVLADGRSVTGSAYATITGNSNIPDWRGVYLRGKNNGRTDGYEDPYGEATLGDYQGSHIKGHTHAWSFGAGNNLHSYNSDNTIQTIDAQSGAGAVREWGRFQGSQTEELHYTSGITDQSTLASQTNPGGAQGVPSQNALDTRPNSAIINWFIRIN